MSALDKVLEVCGKFVFEQAYIDACAELAALRARVAELEAAQAATLTPRKCGTCQQAAEQMREAAANMCQDLANRTEIFSGAIDTKRNREVRAEHKIYSNLVVYIRSLPLPTCCDCNPLAPSSAVDELHGVKCECWCECDNYASRNLKGVLLCDKCADD